MLRGGADKVSLQTMIDAGAFAEPELENFTHKLTSSRRVRFPVDLQSGGGDQ